MAMIIVQGTFEVDPNTRDEYLAQRAAQLRSCRTEPGCIEYVMAADPIVANRVVLSERWESQAHFDEHPKALALFREAAAANGTTPTLDPIDTEILVFEVTSTTRLV